MGGPDSAWGMRQEHLLNAAVLQIDLNAIAQRRKDGQGPLNVKTEGAGAYDPSAKNAPLKLYATGIRNGYDLIWASNGHLYVPSNGSAAGGTTPTGGGVTGSSNVAYTEPDYLYDVVQGGYYGHPNPAAGQWVMDGGNPTSGVDPDEVPTYPVGTQPDSNYRGAAFDFGTNYSPRRHHPVSRQRLRRKARWQAAHLPIQRRRRPHLALARQQGQDQRFDDRHDRHDALRRSARSGGRQRQRKCLRRRTRRRNDHPAAPARAFLAGRDADHRDELFAPNLQRRSRWRRFRSAAL